MKLRSRNAAGRSVRVALAALLVAAILLSTPQASVAIFPRHTILGKLFRLTPAGRIYSHFETRKIEYDQAQQWLDERIAEADQRDAVLKELLRMRAIDGHSYVQARSLNNIRRSEYVEIKDRMTRITRDNFQRAMGQEVLDRLVPRILAHRKFQETLGEVNEAFDTTRGYLEDGVLRIDQLAAKADLGFLSKAREATRRLIARIDKKELTGALLAPVRKELERLDGRLGQLQKDLPELAKPEEVKRLQEEARQAAQSLQSTQDSVNQAVQRVRDQGTVVIPVRSAARDKVIQEKLKTFQTDQNMTRNAISAALGRGAEQRRVNAAIGEAMDRLGIDRSDRSYIYLRKMALEALLARGISTSDLSDEELVTLWEEALADAQERYAQPAGGPAIGTISMHVSYPSASTDDALAWTLDGKPGTATWHSFGSEVIDPSLPCTFDVFCLKPMETEIETLELWLDFDLDHDQVTGALEGTLVGDIRGFGAERFGEAAGTFRGQITGGSMRYDSSAGGWLFEGEGWVEIQLQGGGVCCPSCLCDKTGRLESVSIEGSGKRQIPLTLSGSTVGRPTLHIWGEEYTEETHWRFNVACLECKLPVDLPAR
jgi:hypothetical protein